ncbi:MAG: hypothetical protein GX593_08535 [Actinomycetales bacterium]|nr:hypothetical protein [Actinomycetales bacterium]
MARIRAIHLVDVLVYVVVIALFVQFFPAVISESFAITLLTAVLLKVVLEVVVVAKTAVVGRIKGAATTPRRVLGALALLFVGAGSKFLVLELTDLVFGESVYLGGFFQVTALILVLMASRLGVRQVVA